MLGSSDKKCDVIVCVASLVDHFLGERNGDPFLARQRKRKRRRRCCNGSWFQNVAHSPGYDVHSSPWYRWPIEIDGLRFLKMVDLSMAMLNNQMIEITLSSLLGKKGRVIDQSFWDGLLHHCASESAELPIRCLEEAKDKKKEAKEKKEKALSGYPAIRSWTCLNVYPFLELLLLDFFFSPTTRFDSVGVWDVVTIIPLEGEWCHLDRFTA